jgi:hypothetical protein
MNTPRASRGNSFPWQSHTGRKVCGPEAISIAGSMGTPKITGVARSAEARHSERSEIPWAYPVMRAPMGRSSQVQEPSDARRS